MAIPLHRYFAKVKDFKDQDFKLPERATQFSAGYDFFAPEDVTIPSFWKGLLRKIFFGKPIYPTTIHSHVKAKMRPNEVLEIFNRSSNPRKLGLVLANGVGVVDSDYFGNPSNDGDIGFPFYNFMPWDITIRKDQKLGQGVFHSYLRVDTDRVKTKRTGGFGSTGA